MSRSWTLLAVLAAAALAGCATAVEPLDARREPAEVLAEYQARKGLPGIVVRVQRGEEVLYEAAAGIRRVGGPDAVTVNDPFHIGSNTKAMTALLLARLVDRGLLRWDSTLGDTIGQRVAMQPAYRAVTVEQLLAHTAGLPAALPAKLWEAYFPWDSTTGSDRARMVRETLALEPASAPGTAWAYSNLGYVVAGYVAEQVTRTSWEELMRENLFEALGMAFAGFGPPARGHGGTVAAPWGHDPAPVDPDGPYGDNPAALGPAGTVHANAGDLAAFATVFWNGGRNAAGRTIVSPESLAELVRPRLAGYALGWAVATTAEGDTCLQHAGSNTMFYSVIVVCPSRQFTLSVQANRGDEVAGTRVTELAAYFAKRFGGVEPARP